MRTMLFLLLASLTVAAPLQAKSRKPHVWAELNKETSIPFPHRGSIRNFEANEDRGIWLEDQQRRWYYAELFSSCTGLRFAQAVGFDTSGTAQLDKFGSIIVERQKCQIARLVTAEEPLPRKERLKRQKQVRAEAKKAVAPKD